MVKLKNEIKRQYFHWILYIMDFSIYKAGLTCFPQWEISIINYIIFTNDACTRAQ